MSAPPKAFDPLADIRVASWPRMMVHDASRRLMTSRQRFDVVACGRRSGKTTHALRRLLFGDLHTGGNHRGCLTAPPGVDTPTYVYGAPTHQQAIRVAWSRVLGMLPKWAIAKKHGGDDHWISFVNGALLYVMGMEAHQRIEGINIDGFVLDEYADMKPEAYTSSIRPALDTPGRPPGWGMFIGRPRGHNHFYELFEAAERRENWARYHWPSWTVMGDREVREARHELDELSFRQEYGGEFVGTVGRIYYQWSAANVGECTYDPTDELLIALDFNVAPGVAVIAQDYPIAVNVLYCGECGAPDPGRSGEGCNICNRELPYDVGTQVVGEVWQEIDSNARMVSEEILQRWGAHRGPISVYGDATGGSRSVTSERSAWGVVEDYLSRHWPHVRLDLADANPAVRDRVVVVNSRLRNASDLVRIRVDPDGAPHTITDFEGVQRNKNGDIDKDHNPKLTHLTDAIGYLLHRRYGAERVGAELEVTHDLG